MIKLNQPSASLEPESPAACSDSTKIVAYMHGPEMWGYFTLWMPARDYGADPEEAKQRYRQDVKDHLQKLVDYL